MLQNDANIFNDKIKLKRPFIEIILSMIVITLQGSCESYELLIFFKTKTMKKKKKWKKIAKKLHPHVTFAFTTTS